MADELVATTTPVGFVGLGRMGAPMASRLAAAGHPVLGYDVSAAHAQRLSGTQVRLAGALGALHECDTVILMLPNSTVVHDALVDSGLLDGLRPGSLVIDMSSSVPQRTRELAALARDKGIDLVDAPVSGGVAGAERGTLTAMVGGDAGAVERAKRLLAVLAARVVPTGEVGSGHAVKALNNLMSATHLLVTSEALLAAREFGLDVRLALEVVNGSSGRSGSTENKWPNFVLPGTFDSGFSLELMLKDMRIALDLEHASGIFAPLSEAAVRLWAEAAQDAPPGADHTRIVEWLQARAKRKTPDQVA